MMVKIDYDKFCRSFNDISNCEEDKNYIKIAIFEKEGFYGEINNNDFWLQKRKSRLYDGRARYFKGKIVNINGYCYITGKFVFTPRSRKKIYIDCLLLVLLCVFILIDTRDVIPFIIMLLICSICYSITILVDRLRYSDDEKEVIEYLKKFYKQPN